MAARCEITTPAAYVAAEVNEARQRVEEYYREQGFNDVEVEADLALFALEPRLRAQVLGAGQLEPLLEQVPRERLDAADGEQLSLVDVLLREDAALLLEDVAQERVGRGRAGRRQ